MDDKPTKNTLNVLQQETVNLKDKLDTTFCRHKRYDSVL